MAKNKRAFCLTPQMFASAEAAGPRWLAGLYEALRPLAGFQTAQGYPALSVYVRTSHDHAELADHSSYQWGRGSLDFFDEDSVKKGWAIGKISVEDYEGSGHKFFTLYSSDIANGGLEKKIKKALKFARKLHGVPNVSKKKLDSVVRKALGSRRKKGRK